jgi:MFS family permease
MTHALNLQQYSSKKFFLIFLIVFVALFIDLSLSNISDIIADDLTSPWGVSLFAVISLVYAVGQYFILELVKIRIKQHNNISTEASILHKSVTYVQYVLTGLIIFALLQIFVTSSYLTVLLIIATAISYGLAAVLTTLLAKRLFSWFRINRSLVVVLYGIAAALISINAVDSIIFFDGVLVTKPPEVTPESEVIFEVGFDPASPMSIVATVQLISVIGYFVVTWVATSILLLHHIKRVGKVKYWLLISLPLIYFMSYYITLYETLNPSTPFQAGPGLMLPILLSIYSITACGVLFGIGFKSLSRSIEFSSPVRDYLTITAFGFILFFNAGDATVLQAPYPPFGLANVSFVGLSAYLILIGLSYSAISIAQDVELRKYVKKSAANSSKMLESIGTAQMKKEVEKKLLAATKETQDLIEEKSGIQTSLTDIEIKQYMDEIIDQLTKTGKDNGIKAD